MPWTWTKNPRCPSLACGAFTNGNRNKGLLVCPACRWDNLDIVVHREGIKLRGADKPQKPNWPPQVLPPNNDVWPRDAGKIPEFLDGDGPNDNLGEIAHRPV